MCCKAKSVCYFVSLVTGLNALEELHVERTLGFISQHRPEVVACLAEPISPTMQLISAAFIAETFVEPYFASVVGITCATHHSRELVVPKHSQKRVAVQPNTRELPCIVCRLAAVLRKVRQLLCGSCWAFGVGTPDSIRHMRVCQNIYGRVGTHTDTIRSTLQILMAKTIGLEEAVNSWPGAMRKSLGRAHQCSVAQAIGTIKAIQCSFSAP
jgi:hypothetical protein